MGSISSGVADITYVAIVDGFAYVAVILRAWSRWVSAMQSAADRRADPLLPHRPSSLRARAVRDRLNDRFFCRKSRDAGNKRTCDERLGAEPKDNAITGLRLCRTPSLNHAVVVNRVGRRNFDGAKSRGIRSWLARYDRSQRIVGKDWVNIETAAEAEGLASRQVRNLGQVNNRWRFRQVIGHV